MNRGAWERLDLAWATFSGEVQSGEVQSSDSMDRGSLLHCQDGTGGRVPVSRKFNAWFGLSAGTCREL